MKRHLLALATSLLVGAPSFAVPVTLHNFEFGYEAMHSAQFGTLYTGALVGELNGGAPNSFVTFCSDLYQHFYWNVTYTDYQLAATGSANGLTATQALMLGRLYTTAGTVNTHDETVAFQMAVWELTHDTTPGDIHSGSFSIDGGGTAAQMALVQDWVHAAVSATTGSNFVVTRLYSPTAQDFLVANRVQGLSNQVPEPNGIALVIAALAAMGSIKRRLARKA